MNKSTNGSNPSSRPSHQRILLPKCQFFNSSKNKYIKNFAENLESQFFPHYNEVLPATNIAVIAINCFQEILKT